MPSSDTDGIATNGSRLRNVFIVHGHDETALEEVLLLGALAVASAGFGLWLALAPAGEGAPSLFFGALAVWAAACAAAAVWAWHRGWS